TLGILFGLVAAVGQGGGAVLSRIAYQAQGTLNHQVGTVDGILMGTAAGYQRLLGGLLVIATVYLLGKFYKPLRSVPRSRRAHDPISSKCSWIMIAAITGPVVGITFFQWALMITEAAIAQTIVALTPIVILPMSYWFEGERPKPRSILGGFIAVCGVILLVFS
ncbi:MAG: EamA family transporter, partial [Opitutales bacterium]